MGYDVCFSFIKSTYKHVRNSGLNFIGGIFPFGSWLYLTKKVCVQCWEILAIDKLN